MMDGPELILPAATVGASVETSGGSAGTSRAVTVNTGAANAKGAWTQLIAATVGDATWVTVLLSNYSGGGKYLIDLGIGGAGSETVLVPNIPFHSRAATASDVLAFHIPVLIPAGTRIAARVQSSAGSQTIDVGIALAIAPIPRSAVPRSAATYGVTTASSDITDVDPGGTANTEGAWTEITSATTAAVTWLMIHFGGKLVNRAAAQQWLVDIGTGAAASEVALISDIPLFTQNGGDEPCPKFILLPVSIPTGTRLSMRCQCSVNTTTDRVLSAAITGLT